MSYKIITIPTFEKELKSLSKKYHSIKLDLSILCNKLIENPIIGDEIFKDCYKIRMAISSKGKM